MTEDRIHRTLSDGALQSLAAAQHTTAVSAGAAYEPPCTGHGPSRIRGSPTACATSRTM